MSSTTTTETPPSQAAIARALGLSPARVCVLKARGMPTHSAEAAAEWRRLNLREHLHRKGAPPSAQGSAAGSIAAPPPGDPGRDAGFVSYSEARRREAVARAILAERAAAEQAGELVRAAEVTHSLAAAFSHFRTGLLQLPARLAPELAAVSDQAVVHRLLDDGLHQCLHQLREESARWL